MNQPHLIIDTDPGVDDALALLMAHAHGHVHALTIAAGNVGLAHTVRNALTLMDVIGADTPVHPGCPVPLVQTPSEDAALVHGADGFGDVGFADPKRTAENESAALALIRLSHAHPEATLVALGPLTNVALAVRLDPSLPSRIGRFVIMGGAVNGHGNTMSTPAEFNIGFDPEAAHVVFEAFPAFELVDWEATVRHAFDGATFDRWLEQGDERAKFYAQIGATSRAWNARRGRTGVIAADALAMAVALDPALVQRAETHPVMVEMNGARTRGMTVVDWEARLDRPANARIVFDVDMARFEALVARALGVPDAAI
ncbi:nucleoside hydrolase [Oleiagrimonas soli]|uniref:Nucleoside hydrolase n=1 Tax=Oleiagrimonas soli TaxID=1543381 RepID=A0A099CVC4_9GAMM|nr:nucleoside hydrolase [Oleiagrimonas soli]KGI76970.1 nucleoside hydrolase [Oleiagrimonas soli]MBB6185303.1 purine nucleosidase [Oleiagrimonas soli]